jgi:hypothetical protein
VSLQSLRQASIRGVTSTTGDYNSDWMALFDGAGIAAGDFNSRMLLWLNGKLSASHTSLPAAQAAFADSLSASNWSSIGTFTP